MAKLIGDEGAPLCARIQGKRVLELGSGTGLAGLCAAVIGSDVIVSDLPTVTDYSLRPNIVKNASADGTAGGGALLDGSAWPDARRVGSGYVSCMALDWTAGVPSCAFGVASRGAGGEGAVGRWGGGARGMYKRADKR